MAEGKKSFILYCDQRGVFNKLSDEQAGVLIKHIFAYVSDENPESDFVTELAFESIKQQLKRDLVKYEERADRSRENGSKGGRPPKPKKPSGLNKNPDEPKKPDTVTDTVNVNETVNESKVKKVNPPHFLIDWIEMNAPRVQKLKEPITNEQAERIANEFEIEFAKQVFTSMHNYKKLTSNVISANLTFRKWAAKDQNIQPNGTKPKTRAADALENIAKGGNEWLNSVEGLGSFGVRK